MIHDTVNTADGPFSILVGLGIDHRPAVIASGWTATITDLLALVHADIIRISQAEPASPNKPASTSNPASPHGLVSPDGPARQNADTGLGQVMDQARRAVHSYYSGDFAPAMEVPVSYQASSYRLQAMKALHTVGPSTQLTYSQFAALTGRPAAVRAAASACSHNPAALFIPCHRIVPTGTGKGGFRYGLDIKNRLLEREAQALTGLQGQ